MTSGGSPESFCARSASSYRRGCRCADCTAANAEQARRYRATPAGRAADRRAKLRYFSTPGGKAAQRRYWQSDKGRAAGKRHKGRAKTRADAAARTEPAAPPEPATGGVRQGTLW